MRGIHAHIGSQLFDLAPYREAVAAIAELGDFAVYDLGGGLAVAYTPEHRPPSIDEWVAGVTGAAARAARRPRGRAVLEPGRSLVANAGVTLYTVESVKRRESTWVAVDGGHVRQPAPDALRRALLGRRRRPARLRGRAGRALHLVGKHCESGDVIACETCGCATRGPVTSLVTPVTGAYGHAMANNYNGVPRPPVVFCAGGEARVVVRRETLEDLVARDV